MSLAASLACSRIILLVMIETALESSLGTKFRIGSFGTLYARPFFFTHSFGMLRSFRTLARLRMLPDALGCSVEGFTAQDATPCFYCVFLTHLYLSFTLTIASICAALVTTAMQISSAALVGPHLLSWITHKKR